MDLRTSSAKTTIAGRSYLLLQAQSRELVLVMSAKK